MYENPVRVPRGFTTKSSYTTSQNRAESRLADAG
jgi:hypothetical protein